MSPRREQATQFTTQGNELAPNQRWEVDLNVWVRGRKSIVSIPHLGRNLKLQTARKVKTHPCCSFSQTQFALIATRALSWGPLRGGKDANAGPLSMLRFPGLTNKPQSFGTQGTYSSNAGWPFTLMPARLWKSLWGFHTWKSLPALHCFGVFGTRQENKGQIHLRSWSPTSKIQNYL